MPGRDRNENFAFAIIIASCCLLISLPIFGLMLSEYAKVHDTNVAYQRNAERDRQATGDEIAKACFNTDFVTFSVCIKEKVATYYHQQATNQDLQAQQDQAYWAEALFWLNAIQILFSGFGILLVVRSLNVTRTATSAAIDAAKAATKSAELQEESFRDLERPYLFLVIKETKRLYRPGNEVPHVSYTFTNYGKTPAILDHIFIELRPISDLQFVNGMPRIPMNAGEGWYDVIAPGNDLSEIEPRKVYVKNAKGGDIWAGKNAQELALHGAIGYQDPGGNHYSDHFVMVGNEGGSSFQIKARKQTTNL